MLVILSEAKNPAFCPKRQGSSLRRKPSNYLILRRSRHLKGNRTIPV
jgi:hypothetical protein